MSLSPPDVHTLSQSEDFLAATRRLDRLTRAGASWSGHEKNVALLNLGVGAGQSPRFADISALSGFDLPDDGRSLAMVDWDNDGDLDLWGTNRTGPQVRFWENSTPSPADGGPASLRLLLRGDGRTVSRDAVGARAELVVRGPSGPLPRLLRAVRLGDTHGSQSTRWLHFGLGNWTAKHRLERLEVRWPSGKTESFTGLDPNRRYVLEMGKRPRVLEAPRRQRTGVEVAAAVPTPTQPLPRRIIYSNRLPPPPLRWKTLDTDQLRSIADHIGRPFVILLWTSTCENCRRELDGLAEIAAPVTEAQTALVAINLDQVTTEGGAGRSDARERWASLRLPFEAGVADAGFLDRLESFRSALHWVGVPIRVPSAWFFDASGRLAAVTEGGLDRAQWTGMLAEAAQPAERWLDRALPFPGRTYGPVARLTLADVPQHLLEDEAFDIAAEYLASHRSALDTEFRAGSAPGYPRALYTLAVDQARRGHESDALATYRQVLAVQPAHVDARYNLAVTLTKLGQSSEAHTEYSRLLEHVPQHAAAWHNRALLRHDAGDFAAARADYQKALELAPGQPDTLNNIANTLVALGEVDGALAHLESALRVAPDDARTHYNHGVALEMAVRWTEAARAYARAVELDPNRAQYHHNLGVLRAKQARYDEAEASLKRALELDPQHPTAARNLDLVRAQR